MTWIDSHQVGVLSRRYMDIVLGDLRGMILLLAIAPLIGGAIAGVWSNEGLDTLTLYFVMCLSAFFFGAVNSCREIVKERSLFLREKMFNLSAGAYLVSKYYVQLIVVIVQCVLLSLIVDQFVSLRVNILFVGAVLIGVAVTGTAVGLLVSSVVNSPDWAVALVPLVVIPQILFSDIVLGQGRLSNWTGIAQKLMPVHWGYEMLRQLRMDDIKFWTMLEGPMLLAAIIAGCFLFSWVRLANARY